MAKIAKFRLVLDVDYELNGEDKETLHDILFRIPEFLAGKGPMTGETAAEVDRWSASVKKRK